jgi:nucleoside-diphosphate-sugar epimerase
MQTILGANGQIANELARELRRTHTTALRLVSRHPRKVHADDTLVAANLLDAAQTAAAVQGSDIVYFTAGLPQDDRLLTEDTPFAPVGAKGRVRAAMASRVLAEMARGQIPVLIARAPEFYGPGQTQGVTNALVIDALRTGKTPRVPVRDDTRRTLIWTPDASRALAVLGNTADAYGQTWHLPCDDARLTYREFVTLACELFGRPVAYKVLGRWMLTAAALFSRRVRELRELLPRYGQDNRFDSTKFKRRFPEFKVTTYREGLAQIARESTERG